MLLVEQPGAVGQVREVLGEAPTTLYVTVKARPEQGEIAPHSLIPVLSIVVTSTTPGPFAVPTVHEPVVAEPLMQIEVREGPAINVPRAAAVGCKTAGSFLR